MTMPSLASQGAAVAGDTSVSGFDVQYAPNVALGQKMFIAIMGDDLAAGSLDWDTPSGWTRTGQQGTGARRCFCVLERVATSTDVAHSLAGDSVHLSCSATNGTGPALAQMQVAANANATESITTGTAASATVTPGSITTTKDNSLALMACAYESSSSIDAIIGNTGGTWQAQAPTLANGFMIDWQYAQMPIAGTISGGNAAISSSLRWLNVCFGLQGSNVITVDCLSPLAFAGGVADVKPLSQG